MEIEDKCNICGSYKPWICILKNNNKYDFPQESIERKCKNCNILPIYKFINKKNIYINHKPMPVEVYEFDSEYNRYAIFED